MTIKKEDYNIQTVEVLPNDVILLQINDNLNIDNCRSIYKEMCNTFPNNTILLVNKHVLQGMSIIRQGKQIANAVVENIIDKPLEEIYPDLFTPLEEFK